MTASTAANGPEAARPTCFVPAMNAVSGVEGACPLREAMSASTYEQEWAQKNGVTIRPLMIKFCVLMLFNPASQIGVDDEYGTAGSEFGTPGEILVTGS